MTGGVTGNDAGSGYVYVTNTTEFVGRDGTTLRGPDLPKPLEGHCQVFDPSLGILLVGGRDNKVIYHLL